jgi:hypothetical protein
VNFCKGTFETLRTTDFHDLNAELQIVGSRPHAVDETHSGCLIVTVEKQHGFRQRRKCLLEHFETLLADIHNGKASDVASWVGEAVDKSRLDRICDKDENDRIGLGSLFGCERGVRCGAGNLKQLA